MLTLVEYDKLSAMKKRDGRRRKKKEEEKKPKKKKGGARVEDLRAVASSSKSSSSRNVLDPKPMPLQQCQDSKHHMKSICEGNGCSVQWH